jgi:hypothetical protein
MRAVVGGGDEPQLRQRLMLAVAVAVTVAQRETPRPVPGHPWEAHITAISGTPRPRASRAIAM